MKMSEIHVGSCLDPPSCLLKTLLADLIAQLKALRQPCDPIESKQRKIYAIATSLSSKDMKSIWYRYNHVIIITLIIYFLFPGL